MTAYLHDDDAGAGEGDRGNFVPRSKNRGQLSNTLTARGLITAGKNRSN